MNDALFSLEYDIEAILYECYHLERVIKDLAKEPDVDNVYFKEIADRYMSLCNKLRILLEAYFAEEKQINSPTNFRFRRLYKEVIS